MLLNLICIASVSQFIVEAARILTVVPTPSYSHQIVFRPLTQELAKRGHQVVVITTDPAFPKGQSPENLIEIDLHDISSNAWRQDVLDRSTQNKPEDSYGQVKSMLQLLTKVFEIQMETKEVRDVINKNQFDLLIIEACVQAAFGLTHIIKVPVISMSTASGLMDVFDIVGAPSRPPLIFPTILRQRLHNLTLWEKIVELYNEYKMTQHFNSLTEENDKTVKRLFGPDTPSIAELYKNIDVIFLSVYPIWDLNRPVPTNLIYIGSLQQKGTKELPKDLKTYLDSSKHGVIYISYGSNVMPSLLPPGKIQTLVKVFSELRYDVLWKWDKDELPNRSPNIKISKWLPQLDLLKHPKVKLFITQGGLQSTHEAICAAVPLIGMPTAVDQWYNVEMYVHHKIGVRLDLKDVTTENFKNAINTVIEDASYKTNIEKLRSIMEDQPQKPLERAVWWTEHLLRHGSGDHLKARAANMSWSEYLDVELLTAIGFCAISLLVVIGFLVNLLYRLVRRNLLSRTKLKNK